jgi:predicted nicotinamide N-methyase
MGTAWPWKRSVACVGLVAILRRRSPIRLGVPVQLEANVASNPVHNGCSMATSLLVWGEHAPFKERFPAFDIVIAADVIYEDAAVIPLLQTAADLMASAPVEALFILSFARRNVSITRVLDAASSMGLDCRVDEGFSCSSPGEHVYLIRRKAEQPLQATP